LLLFDDTTDSGCRKMPLGGIIFYAAFRQFLGHSRLKRASVLDSAEARRLEIERIAGLPDDAEPHSGDNLISTEIKL
jgi:hypothetical protein